MDVGDNPRTGAPVPLAGSGTPDAWQVGVGPGAVVVHGVRADGNDHWSPDPPSARADPAPDAAGRALAAALAHGTACPVVVPGHPPVAAHRVLVPGPGPTGVRVRGAGPIARRLRRTLADPVLEDAPARAPEVLVHQHVVPPEVALAAARGGRLVLPVVVQPRRVVVGPVTVPSGPCLHCLDLHRRDRDPRWAFVATHLGHPVEQVHPAPVPDALQAAAEGLVVLLVDAVRGGRPLQPGLVHEVGLPAPHVVTRRWAVHPGCPWHPDATVRTTGA